MTVKYRTIGCFSYNVLSSNNNVISNLNQYSGYNFLYESTITGNYLHVKIEEYPVNGGLGGAWNAENGIFEESDTDEYSILSSRQDVTDKYFLIQHSEQFFSFFNLYGRYVITFKEYTSDDVLYSTQVMYFDINSLNNEISFPFPGEGYEYDSEDGWSPVLNESLVALEKTQGNVCNLCVTDCIYLEKGSLCEITDVYMLNQDEILFEIDLPDTEIDKNVYGIIIDIYEDGFLWDEDNSVVKPLSIYKVAFKGKYVVSDLSLEYFMLYLDNINKAITSDSNDVYFGKWDSDNNVLLIEKEIAGYNTNIDLNGSSGSLIKRGSTEWEELGVGVEGQILKTEAADVGWNNPNILFENFKNNSGVSIPKGVCVQFGGIYDNTVRFVDQNDITSFTLNSNMALDITLDSLNDDKANIKQFIKTNGTLGEQTLSDVTATTVTTSKSKIFKCDDNSSTVWFFFATNDGVDSWLSLKRYDMYTNPNFTDTRDLVSFTDGFDYTFHFIDSDCGLLVTTDDTTVEYPELKIYYVSKQFGTTLIETLNYEDLPEDIVNLDHPIITKHDDLFVIYYRYIKEYGSDYQVGINCITINNIDWDDITSTEVVNDEVEVVSSIIVGSDEDITYDVVENENNTDVIVFNYYEADDIYVETLIIRDFDTGLVEVDESSITSLGIDYFTDSSDLQIIKLEENKFVLGFISSSNSFPVAMLMYAFNDKLDTFVVGDNFYYPPVLDEVSNVNTIFEINALSENQFAFAYVCYKTGDYKCTRLALGNIINDSSIFFQEMVDPVKYENTRHNNINTYHDLVFSTPVSTNGVLFVKYVNGDDEMYIAHYEYLKEDMSGIVGISQEAIANGSTGKVGIGGVVECAEDAVIPRINYYCDDEGTITSTPTSINLGQAVNTGKILFTPILIRN